MTRRDMLSLMTASVLALLLAACDRKGSLTPSGGREDDDKEEGRDY